MAHKASSYVVLAFLGSLIALFDSGYELSFMLLMRIAIISLCCYLLHGQFAVKRWYFGLGIVVDEARGEHMELMLMKLPMALMYVLAIIGCAASGMLFGFENAY